MQIKRAIVRSVHKYLGLLIALWVISAGLTGSILSFHREIDEWLNPALFEVRNPESRTSPELWKAALDDYAVKGAVTQIDFPADVASPVAVAHLKTGQDITQIYIDPSTSTINGYRLADQIGLSSAHIVRTIYLFHSELLMGEIGLTVIGLLALGLVVTSLFGIYLWYPRGTGRSYPFRIAPRSRGIRLAYEVHRVSGAYLLLPLLIVAVSGLSFAFPTAFAMISRTSAHVPEHRIDMPRYTPADWPGLVRQISLAHPEVDISGVAPASPDNGMLHHFFVRFPGEFRRSYGGSRIIIDPLDGRVVTQIDATRLPANHRFIELLFPLHSGEVAGISGRICILLTGCLLSLLASCALIVWAGKKRLKQRKGAH